MAEMTEAAAFPADAVLLTGTGDAYDGVLVDARCLPETKADFTKRLRYSLEVCWRYFFESGC